MKFNCSYTQLVEIHKLQPNPKNANQHPDRQIELLAKIIDYQGQRAPIVVSKRSGFITKGHGRLMALQKLGWQKVAVDYQAYDSEAQEYADLIADNKIAELAKHDDAMMIEDLKSLDIDDFELLGLDDFDLPIEPDEAKEEIEDDIPTDVETRCKPGDLWILGEHRLLCADSTDILAVERLMDGEKADMVFTDPPYNIGFSGSMSNTTVGGVMVKHKGANQQHDKIKNDAMNEQEFIDFTASWLSVLRTAFEGPWYISFGSQTLEQLLLPLRQNNMDWKSIIIWKKNQATLSGKDYKGRYEPIVYGRTNDVFFAERFLQEDIWEFQRTLKNDLHPTMKPIPLIEQALNNSSKQGSGVLDLFGGSGSTLIACEKTNRKCYMMELDEKYCDVILKRFEDYSGKKAELKES